MLSLGLAPKPNPSFDAIRVALFGGRPRAPSNGSQILLAMLTQARPGSLHCPDLFSSSFIKTTQRVVQRSKERGRREGH